MSVTWDFAVQSADGAVVALVEAKRRLGTDPAWARALRRSMIARWTLTPNAEHYLVAPDRIYFWEAQAPVDAEPSKVAEADRLLGPYFRRAHIDPASVDPLVFEDVVGLWLRDVVDGRADAVGKSPRLLGGSVVRELHA